MALTLIPFYQEGIEQTTFLGLVLCLLAALVHYRSGRVVKYPPGPKPWPIVGNLFYFTKLLKAPPQEFISLAQKFGSLCMLWIGGNPVLIINDTKVAKEILDKNGAITADRPRKNMFAQHAWPNFIAFAGAHDARFFRRIYAELVGPKQSDSVRKYQDYESRILLRDLLESPDHFMTHVERTATSAMFSAVYGVRISRIDHPIMVELFDVWAKMFEMSQHGKLIIDYIPILERLPLSWQPWVRLADSYVARETAISARFLHTLRQQIEIGMDPACFGVGIINHQKKEGFDDNLAIGLLSGIILAGSETSTTMVHSFFKVIAMHPEAQQRAQEELDQVVGPSRLPTWEDAPNLPYVRALIKELHRTCPLVSLAIPHVSTEEYTYQGLTVPKGTIIMGNVENLHKDPNRYDEGHIFAPERYLGDNLDANTSAKQPDYMKRDHVNYGFGRRLCQGIHVAENSLFIQISRLLWAFKIAPRPGEPPLDLADRSVEEIVKKPNPFMVDITPRSEVAVQVVQQSVREAVTDIPDVDSIEMAN